MLKHAETCWNYLLMSFDSYFFELWTAQCMGSSREHGLLQVAFARDFGGSCSVLSVPPAPLGAITMYGAVSVRTFGVAAYDRMVALHIWLRSQYPKRAIYFFLTLSVQADRYLWDGLKPVETARFRYKRMLDDVFFLICAVMAGTYSIPVLNVPSCNSWGISRDGEVSETMSSTADRRWVVKCNEFHGLHITWSFCYLENPGNGSMELLYIQEHWGLAFSLPQWNREI